MRTKRIVSLILVFCMLFTCIQLTSFAEINDKAKSFDVPDGGVLIEAEDATIKKAQGVSIERGDGASGKCVLSEKDWRKEAFENEKAAVEFFFVPKVDGVYHVWIRFSAVSAGGDSIFLSANGSVFAQAPKTTSTGGADAYEWAEVHTTPNLKAGEKYNIGFLPRETSFRLDQIIVTNTNVIPSGLVKDISTMKPAEVEPTGSGLNEKATVIDLEENGKIIEVEDTTITDEQGFSVVNEKSASNGKVVVASIRSTDVPKVSAPAAIEFYINPVKRDTYYIWLRYSALNDGTDSMFISKNGAAYAQQNAPKTEDDTAYTWVKLAATTPLEIGQKYNIRFRPREKDIRLDQILVTNSSRFIPTNDKMTELPDPNAIVITPCDTTIYPTPSITPPAEHPRLMFRSSDIPKIKENMTKEESTFAVSEFNRLLNLDINDGLLPNTVNNKENYKDDIIGGIEARAFDYAINGNEASGKAAVSGIKNFLSTIDFGDRVSILYRYQGYCVFIASEVYDWCHPLLTEDDKKQLVSLCQGMASEMEIGWPPTKQGAVSGHGAESQLMRDMFSFAIATYDEYPDMYQMIAGRLLSEYIEPRDFYYQSGTWHQGVSYNPYRLAAGMWMNYLFKVMCGYDVISADQSHILDSQLYIRRPDGQILREGDVMESEAKGSYMKQSLVPFYMAANMFGNPYYKREVMRSSNNYDLAANGPEAISFASFLILNDADLEQRTLSELPKTKYFGSPNGTMIARTGWSDGMDSPDVIAFMKIGEVYAANHNHLDSGNFQIYYKGILASESGNYSGYGSDYDCTYHKGTIAHNTLLIYDPDEKMVNSKVTNTGGQRGPSGEFNNYDSWINGETFDTKFGTVLAHEFGPDQINPEYNYLKGDITNAYSDKVSEVLRSMMFVPTQNKDYPAVFFVMDKVTSTNKDFDKYWIMHSQQEPEINGNATVIKNDATGYNGMLVNQTLYPKNASISYVGGEGHENEFNGKTSPNMNRWGKTSVEESTTFRLDVRPKDKTETDYFLNAMYVGDADKNLPLEKASLIETDKLLGAKLLDKVCIFTKDAGKLTEQSFTVDGNEENLSFIVSGLETGSYDISVNGSKLASQIATAEGSTIYFDGPAGAYTITRTDANATREAASAELPKYDTPIKIKIGSTFIYSDVDPVIVNDRTLLPMRALFENIGADVTYDEATSSATASDEFTEIKITEGSNIAYVNGVETSLDVPAMIISDRFMVPVRFISESMGLTVAWADRSQVVTITGMRNLDKLKEYGAPTKFAKVADVTCLALQDGVAANEPLLAQNAIDLNPATLWAEDGDGRWLLVTLDKEYTINAMAALFNSAKSRTEKFSLEVSTDNQNWTKVLDHATTDGKTEDFQTFTFNPIAAKYVRYTGHCNSSNGWNALKEIMFIPAQ